MTRGDADVAEQELANYDLVSPRQPNKHQLIHHEPVIMAPDIERVVEFLNDPFEPRGDPDAQTTVNDFIDFTEYLSADMIRSLTLIGDLDERYTEASLRVNDLATSWGKRPTLATDQKTSPALLRSDISANLKHAVDSRLFAQSEATRMSENVERHYNKAKVLLSKLQKMMDNYPTDQTKSEPSSPQLSRAKPATATTEPDTKAPKPPRTKRIPKITVPGEVLAPYEIEYDLNSDDSDVSTDDDSEPYKMSTPRIKLNAGHNRKPIQRSNRVMTYTSAAMTAAVAANAAALLNPPPDNAVIGSPDAPWLQLTLYEMAKLRKRMKKNATWTPSETMIARELTALGRGPEEYRQAKRQAEQEGRVFEAQVPAMVTDAESGQQHLPAGAISVDCIDGEGMPISNRGMKLNEAKKLKREAMAKLAGEQGDDYKPSPQHSAGKTPGKRKRDADGDFGTPHAETPSARQQTKRTKMETPILPPNLKHTSPPGSRAAQQTPVPIPMPWMKSGTSPNSVSKTVTTSVPTKAPAQTPVPLPKTDQRGTPGHSHGRLQVMLTNSPALDEPRSRRSLSRGLTPGAESKRPGSRGKAGSQEPPTAANDRPRRASAARITPIPESKPLPKRPKRPAPGIVSRTSSGGNSAVGKRKAAPKKKARATKREKDESEDEEMEEVDDEGNPIDPDEPRYCICDGVSFGTMIQCDNVDVSAGRLRARLHQRSRSMSANIFCTGLQQGMVPPGLRRIICDSCQDDKVVLPRLSRGAQHWREGRSECARHQKVRTMNCIWAQWHSKVSELDIQ